MENRTILALVISFVILFGWAVFFGPQQGRVVPEQTPPSETAGSEREAAVNEPVTGAPQAGVAPAPVSPVPPEVAADTVPEREVKIETPLYTAIFSTAGPALTSFLLKDYRETIEADSPLKDMVALDPSLGNFLEIDFNAGSATGPASVYEVDQPALQMEPGTAPQEVVFRATGRDGLTRVKTLRFYADRYQIDYEVTVANHAAASVRGVPYASVRALPAKKKGYYSFVGMVGYLDGKLKQVKVKDPSDPQTLKGALSWWGYEDDYFLRAVMPTEAANGLLEVRQSAAGVLEGQAAGEAVSLAPGEALASSYTVYLGPRELSVLKTVGHHLDAAINFGWTDIIARPLLYVLRFFYGFVHNYGVAIILLTVLVKILFWPLTHRSYKSMKEMQKLQPLMAKIREKYKDNRQQMNQEMMGLYKTYKVNPMSGCLPMVIQIPVFFALFRILGSAIELRHAPFMLWINDLAAPDRLFSFPFSIPFMAPPYGLPVLTLLMGASMFIQQKMTPTPGDPSQAKLMMFLPLIFTFMFINFPSGLVLYWLVNNVLSIGQQYRIHRGPA